tara:strand:+ start:874 stop:1419 length:546 start_codon:yes stop_codon:yes gene_type:complete
MNFIKKLVLVVLLLQFNNQLFSQDVQKIDGFGINPKIGPSFSLNYGGGSVMGLEVNILKNKFIYSIDYLGHNKFGTLIGFNDPSQNQLSIMMGKYKGEKQFRIQYQAGINVFWGQFSSSSGTQPWIGIGGGSRTSFSTIGVASKIGFKGISSKNVSIGIDLQMNLNAEKTLIMPLINYAFV